MIPKETRETTDLARRIDQNLSKIFLAQFGHVLTLAEWKALPIATRRAITVLVLHGKHSLAYSRPSGALTRRDGQGMGWGYRLCGGLWKTGGQIGLMSRVGERCMLYFTLAAVQ